MKWISTQSGLKSFCTTVTLALTLLLPVQTEAAFEDFGPDPVSGALGTTLSSDPLYFPARATNPAAGSCFKGWGFSAAWCKPYNLSELEQIRVDMAKSGPAGWVISIRAISLGGALYAERTAGVALSHMFSHSIAAGFGFQWNQLSIDRYGIESAPSLDMGLLYRHRLFDAGVSVTGLAAGDFPKFGGEVYPRRFRCSGSLPLDESTRIVIDSCWERNRTTSISAGFEVQIFARLILRGGYESTSERITLGVGIPLSQWRASAAFDHHPYLGWSRSAGLQWMSDESQEP